MLGTEEDRCSANIQDLEAMMREMVQMNIGLKAANATNDRLARADPLTGLANRRMLSETLVREIARANRLGNSLSVIVADLDGFKTVNDTYGHIVGDQVLQSFAAVLSRQQRNFDLAARFGGDEFVILLPETPSSGAIRVAERIRAETGKLKTPAYPFQISISFGIATWTSGETSEDFLDRADLALYRTKRTRPNQILAAPDIPL